MHGHTTERAPHDQITPTLPHIFALVCSGRPQEDYFPSHFCSSQHHTPKPLPLENLLPLFL